MGGMLHSTHAYVIPEKVVTCDEPRKIASCGQLSPPCVEIVIRIMTSFFYYTYIEMKD